MGLGLPRLRRETPPSTTLAALAAAFAATSAITATFTAASIAIAAAAAAAVAADASIAARGSVYCILQQRVRGCARGR